MPLGMMEIVKHKRKGSACYSFSIIYLFEGTEIGIEKHSNYFFI